MRFDHLMHWVPDLGAAMVAYQALGLPVVRGGEHPHLGTHNAAWRHGLTYVELIAVRDWDVLRRARPATAPAIEAVLRSGGGGLSFAVATDDVARAVARARAAGVEVADPAPGSLRRPDGSTASWVLAHLAGPAWAPFFIQYQRPPAERLARVRARGLPEAPWSIQRVTVETAEPAAAADLLGRAIAVAVPAPSPDGAVIALEGCAVVLRPGPGERVVRVALGGADAPRGEVAGLRYERAGDA